MMIPLVMLGTGQLTRMEPTMHLRYVVQSGEMVLQQRWIDSVTRNSRWCEVEVELLPDHEDAP